jgi:hypothetical protein
MGRMLLANVEARMESDMNVVSRDEKHGDYNVSA